MKKLVVLSMLVLATVAAFAQRGGDSDARIDTKVEKLTEQLNLSADQQVKVKSLLKSQHIARKENGEKWNNADEAEKTAIIEKRKARKSEFNSKLATILTPEQNETFKNLPSMHGKGKGKGRFGSHDNIAQKTPAAKTDMCVAKLTEQLDLTAMQQKRLTAVMSSHQKNKKKRKVAYAQMTEAEKTTMKAERKAERAAHEAAVEKILTPEQLVTYKKLKAERKDKSKMNRKSNRTNSKS